MIADHIANLLDYAVATGLVEEDDVTYAANSLLALLGLDAYEPSLRRAQVPIEETMAALSAWGAEHGLCRDSGGEKERFEAALMGTVTPPPSAVRRRFWADYAQSPQQATDGFYRFCQDTRYIRRERTALDLRWKTDTDYGPLDITINLAKPEKDPRDIAAARTAPQGGYPQCLLCPENEGYAGRPGWPGRHNHRLIPLDLGGERWYLQYSPYVYYNEHCIVLSEHHTPMVIDQTTFERLLEFVTRFPHYVVGSNADLPIVGGSILSHEHYQGGRYTFPMELAEEVYDTTLPGFAEIRVAVLHWPMTVLRLTGSDRARLAQLAGRVLAAWRTYSDPEANILAYTDGTPHNTITPIARRRGEEYQLDLVLRNNRTTPEHPLGLFHPHQELHHIKKENIGLIEVMGLAVLPARLKGELEALEQALLTGRDITDDPELAKHAPWIGTLRKEYTFTPDNVTDILRREVGMIFAQVLEHCAVFPASVAGMAALGRFLEQI